MKDREIQERGAAISNRAAEGNQGEIETARVLFGELTAEARRQGEIERERSRRRSPLVKLLLALAVISGLAAATLAFYGFYAFPGAPIREWNGAYMTKQGKPRTKQDYESYKAWEKALIAGFGATLLFAVGFGIAEGREHRRQKDVK